MGNKHMKRCSISLVIKEFTMRFHYIFTRTTTKVSKLELTSQEVRQLELSHIVDEIVKSYSPFGKV